MNTTRTLKAYEFPAVVFITGAIVLVIEIAATRILSPYFGNTIFSFSSIISTILAALSLGYFIGGKRADLNPSSRTFYMTIMYGGWSVLLLQLMSVFVLPVLGMMSFIWGPLVASVILFFIPAFLLGMLSPYAVKLQSMAQADAGIGSVSGAIFFWSTVGSIAGSLSAGFVLIPNFRLSHIMLAVSAALIALGLGGLARHGDFRKKHAAASLAVMLLLGAGIFAGDLMLQRGYAYIEEGVYERLAVQDVYRDGIPVRLFFQDRSLSGGLALASGELFFPYTRYYELYRAFKPDVSSAVFIGGGAYTIPKQLLKELPDATVHVVDIEPSLLEIAQTYFALPPDPRLVNHVTDGRRFLNDSKERFDLIFSDVYNTLYSIPPHLATLEFFELAKSRLTDDGIFIANIAGRLEDSEPSFMLSEIRTFAEAFPAYFVFGVVDPKSSAVQNIMFVGLNRPGPATFEDLAASVPEIGSKYGPHLADLSKFNFEKHPIFTDDYAPVEWFNARAFLRSAQIQAEATAFDGNRALEHVAAQLSIGPRSLRSPGHARVQDWIERELSSYGIASYRQSWDHAAKDGKSDRLTNIVGRLNEGAEKRIIIGSHYDTRRYADLDPNNPAAHMPGANDGSSGVAVMLELARILSEGNLPSDTGVDFVFFDGEEGEEGVTRDEWVPIGSEYFASRLNDFYPGAKPRLGIIVDMVGDSNLLIYRDGYSASAAPDALRRLWRIARDNYPEKFSDEVKYFMIDDHTALNAAGIPSILLIDFDYPYFHTTEDTIDKISAESLAAVGQSIADFLASED